MSTEQSKIGRGAAVRLLYVSALLASAGCGVQEISHDEAPVDTSKDFGPSPVSMPSTGGASATPAAVMPMGTASVPSTPGPASGTPVATPSAMGGAPAPSAMPAPGTPMPAGAPALSGVTIELGDKTVPKEDVIAFIHFGHSNMAGRAIGPTETRPYFFDETHPRAWMYHVGKPPELAHEPDTAGDGSGPNFGGPGTALVKEAAELAPSKYFMSLGFGQTSAYCSQFEPGSLYYDSLIEAAKAIKDRVTFGAIVIMLGITERHGTAADISGFSNCINTIATAVRNDVGRPDLPVLISDYEAEATGMLAVNSTFAQSIIPEIRKIPEVVSNSAIVPTDALPMQDDHHFNFDGHKIYIGRLLQIMKDKGWFPWQ
jgi:hypothetical protein